MNEKLSKFLKFVSRNLGFLMINASVTLILFLFFSNLILQQTDSLKYDLENYILEKSNLTKEDFNEIKAICNNNSQVEECQMLQNYC